MVDYACYPNIVLGWVRRITNSSPNWVTLVSLTSLVTWDKILKAWPHISKEKVERLYKAL